MLQLRPIGLREAFDFIDGHHRHRRRGPGGKVAVGAAVDGQLVGVAVLARPVGRHNDDGWTAEIIRVATDGTRNACSMLLGAMRRVAWSQGYRRLITFTLPEESGASLRAAGFVPSGTTDPRDWSRASRPREDDGAAGERIRWEAGGRRVKAPTTWWYVPEPVYPEDGGWIGQARTAADALRLARVALGYADDDEPWTANEPRPVRLSEAEAAQALERPS